MTDQPTLDELDEHDLDDGTGLPRLILAALEQTRSPACITTAELDPPGPKIVYVNPAYAEMTGRRRENVVGRTPRIMQGPLTDRAVLDRLRANLEAGERFEGETVNYRADGSPFIINWSIDPVRSRSGKVTHYVATQEDVTEKVRLRNLLAAEQLLDDALTEELVDSRDQRRSFTAMAERIAACVDLVAGVGRAQVVIRDDSANIVADAGGGESTAVDGNSTPDGTEVSEEFVRPEAMVRGTIAVTGLDDDQLAFIDRSGLARFVRRAGGVVAALAEYHRQRRVALRLQHDLLPPEDLAVEGLDLATRYRPGLAGLQVGGDWFDAFVLGDTAVLSVGDVAGSGVDAAALMGRLRLLARAEHERGGDGASVLSVLDEICAADERMATMLLVECDLTTGATTTWSAGHLPPIRFGCDAPPSLVPVDTAPPLGHLGGLRLLPTHGRLEPGEGLLLYTDGLIERRDVSLDQGFAGLVEAIAGVPDAQSAVDASLARFGDELDDDVAILVARRLRL